MRLLPNSAFLVTEYGEAIKMELYGRDWTFVLTVNPATQSWTMAAVQNDVACYRASGNGYSLVIEKDTKL